MLDVNTAGHDLQRIIDMIPTLAWSTDARGAPRFLNKTWLEYSGLTAEEARGWGWGSVIHPDDAPTLMAAWNGMLTTGQPAQLEARMRRADGEYRWFLFRTQPLRNAQGEVVEWFGTSSDIEDLKRAEAELEWRLRFTELSASFASAPADQLDSIVHSALKDVGEAIGVDRITIYWLVDPPRSKTTVHKWVRPGIPHPATPAPTPQDAVLNALRSGKEVIVPSFARAETVMRRRGEEFGIRSLFVLPLIIGGQAIAAMYLVWVDREAEWSDVTLHRIRLFGPVVANALGRQRAMLDLESSAVALELAQRELAHITRVTTLGELTASIAHEINQPLAAIVANASACLNWLSMDKPDFAVIRETLEAVTLDGERAGEVLTRIRALLSRSPVAMAPCQVAPIVEGVLPLLRGQLLRDGVELETFHVPGLPRVMGDPVQLQQVVMNLVLNAAEASRDVPSERRCVVVRTSVESDGEVPSVVVAVEDSGIGLEGLEVARLFETFYTTKASGLGMGLAISRSIIERHGGRLWAEANPGQGATFRFALEGIA